MKKQFILIVMLLFVLLSCNSSKNRSNEVEVEAYSLIDSTFIESDYGDGYSYYSLNIDMPVTNNDSLRTSIIRWMLMDSDSDDYETYFQNERDHFFAEDGDEPFSDFSSNFILAEQTDRYVTYISEGYLYTGGAHPMPWYYGTSFSKMDGSAVGYDLFDDPEQLTEIISKNLIKQYFDKYNTEEEEYFFDPNVPFQLPTNQPWIESDSVVFCYGSYEIAPYAAGMPLCKIALTELIPYLSEKGKTFINNIKE